MATSFSPKDIFNIFFSKVDRDEGGDLPDLARVIGHETVVKLLKIYGGQEFKIPKWEVFEKVCRNVLIYLSIESGVPAPRMEAQFNVSRQRAHQLHVQVKEAIQNYREAEKRGDTLKRVFSDDPAQDFAELMQWLAGEEPDTKVAEIS